MPSRRAYRPGRKMIHPAQRFLARNALPAVAVAAAVLEARLLGPSRDIPFTLFFAAVLLGAWYGGLGPALTAVALSLLAVYSFFVPHESNLDMGINLLSRSVRFVLVSGLLIWITESRRRAEEALRESEQSVPDVRGPCHRRVLPAQRPACRPGREPTGVPEPGVHPGRVGGEDRARRGPRHHPRQH